MYCTPSSLEEKTLLIDIKTKQPSYSPVVLSNIMASVGFPRPSLLKVVFIWKTLTKPSLILVVGAPQISLIRVWFLLLLLLIKGRKCQRRSLTKSDREITKGTKAKCLSAIWGLCSHCQLLLSFFLFCLFPASPQRIEKEGKNRFETQEWHSQLPLLSSALQLFEWLPVRQQLGFPPPARLCNKIYSAHFVGFRFRRGKGMKMMGLPFPMDRDWKGWFISMIMHT